MYWLSLGFGVVLGAAGILLVQRIKQVLAALAMPRSAPGQIVGAGEKSDHSGEPGLFQLPTQTNPAPPAATAEVAIDQVAAGQVSAEPVSVLKSGVADGMAYTLYSDGSIEAQLPQGTLRFGSISELRLHLEQSASYLAAERRPGSSSK